MVQSAQRARKYHHLTCSNCRRRKTKCDGIEPVCTTCKGFGDVDCAYDRPASIAYVRHLERQLQTLTKQLESNRIVDTKQPNEGNYSQTKSSSAKMLTGEIQQSAPLKKSMSIPGVADSDVSRLLGKQATFSISTSRHQRKAHLLQMANISKSVEEYALESVLSGVLSFLSLEMARHLLDHYWCRIHPLLMDVYRPTFFQHMLTCDPSAEMPEFTSYSPALLAMMLAESARSLTKPNSEIYTLLDQYAYNFLLQDLRKDSSIATASACMLLAYSMLHLGKSSMAWTYAGTAYRIAEDLQISEDLEITGQREMSLGEVEARKRLGWALYSFDHMASLYFDRPVSCPSHPWSTDEITDDSLDVHTWHSALSNSRHLTENAGNTAVSTACDPRESSDDETYISQPSFSIEVFKWNLKLLIIVGQAFAKTRGDISRIPIESDPYGSGFSILQCVEELLHFWHSVPDHLKVESSLRQVILPHVASFNLTYHAAYIILFLPVLQQCPVHAIDPVVIAHSINATTGIRRVISAYISTQDSNFSLFYVTYAAYLAYQILEIMVAEFSEAKVDGFNADVVNGNLEYITHLFRSCSFSIPVASSTLLYVHNRTKREVAFGCQKKQQVLQQRQQNKLENDREGAFNPDLNLPSNSYVPGLPRHMSASVIELNNVTKGHPGMPRSKSVASKNYTVTPNTTPQVGAFSSFSLAGRQSFSSIISSFPDIPEVSSVASAKDTCSTALVWTPPFTESNWAGTSCTSASTSISASGSAAVIVPNLPCLGYFSESYHDPASSPSPRNPNFPDNVVIALEHAPTACTTMATSNAAIIRQRQELERLL